ncbi:TRAP transporter large permease [Acidaminobacter sp.]|uniref:TRAP transporter large permease n=1 Tax=Acidaminobacter sp. TaxID=1872102 RepID=UPI00138106B4|nr:TRAP transporter large permease [Acidaminobacter sp.]MDK9710159.1 TRAP transporter large permease [Acidaminobacter sp.]MZQ98755.1 TRAP transporter large permease subunit [Acidaminobacter sp.]
MTEVLLILAFITFIAIGVPISFSLGLVAFFGIATVPGIPSIVIFNKMFYGLNSFILLAVPLFILAANLMNHGNISKMLIDFSVALVGHIRGGLAHSNILVSMIFAGVSGSSQADTAGVGKVLIPSMIEQGYDAETAVGVTAASSTIGSIIPPSIVMVVYAGITNASVAALFLAGVIPGIMVGLAMMVVVAIRGKKYNFPKNERVKLNEIGKLFLKSFPALVTPIIIIGGIVSGFFTPTEAAGVSAVYALLVGMFIYKTIKARQIPEIIIETLRLSSLSLFALATANALGELMGYYGVTAVVSEFFLNAPGGMYLFITIVIAFFLFIGTFMDGVPAMILFVPVILPAAIALGIHPVHLGLIVTITLSLGLVTPPYGLCLLIAGSIGKIGIERSFRGVRPYFLVAVLVLLFVAFVPQVVIGIPKLISPRLF